MKQANNYLIELMEQLDVPAEARPVLSDAGKRMMEKQGAEMQRLGALFMAAPKENAPSVFEQLDRIAEICGVHPYTASFVFLCWNVQDLQEHYRIKGISNEVFHDTILDLRYKLAECHEVHHVWGTFVRDWFPGFFALTRFALGRMQYEFSEFQGESHTAGGITVKKGDCVLTMHIPSCGPLTKDLREDSYRRAYTFYQKDFPGKPVIFTCSSWLLYPPHDGMLPKSSNVVSFLHDFDPVFSVETDTFDNAWRIYGADGGKPLDQLPQNTSMQRAYANWLRGGHKAGWGYGIFMFDGRQFIRMHGVSEHL